MMKKSIICIAFLTAMATPGVYAQKAFKAFGETLKTDKRCLYVNGVYQCEADTRLYY